MAETISKVKNIVSGIHKTLECSICLDILDEPFSTKCNHQFCRKCIDKLLAQKNKKGGALCPLCKCKISKRGLLQNQKLVGVVAAVRSVLSAIDEDLRLAGSLGDERDEHKRRPKEVSEETPLQKNGSLVANKLDTGGYSDHCHEGDSEPEKAGNCRQTNTRKSRKLRWSDGKNEESLKVSDDHLAEILQTSNLGRRRKQPRRRRGKPSIKDDKQGRPSADDVKRDLKPADSEQGQVQCTPGVPDDKTPKSVTGCIAGLANEPEIKDGAYSVSSKEIKTANEVVAETPLLPVPSAVEWMLSEGRDKISRRQATKKVSPFSDEQLKAPLPPRSPSGFDFVDDDSPKESDLCERVKRRANRNKVSLKCEKQKQDSVMLRLENELEFDRKQQGAMSSRNKKSDKSAGTLEKNSDFVTAQKRQKKLVRKGKTKKVEFLKEAWNNTCDRRDGSQLIESDHTDPVAQGKCREENENPVVLDKMKAERPDIQHRLLATEDVAQDVGSAIQLCSPVIDKGSVPTPVREEAIINAAVIRSLNIADVQVTEAGHESQIIPGTFSSPSNSDYNVINPMESPLYKGYKRRPVRKKLAEAELEKSVKSSGSASEVILENAKDIAEPDINKQFSKTDGASYSGPEPLQDRTSEEVSLGISKDCSVKNAVIVLNTGNTNSMDMSKESTVDDVNKSQVAVVLHESSDDRLDSKQLLEKTATLECESMKLQHGKTKSGSASLDGSYDTCIKKDGDASGLEESFDDTTPTISGNSSQDSTYAERSPKEDDIEGVLDSVVEKLQAEEENTFIRKDSSEIKESLTAPIICCKNEETINEVVTEEPLMPQESATEASISILNYDNHDDDDDNDDRSADRRSNCASVNFDSNRTRENLLESSGENNNNIEEGYAPPKKVEAAVQTIPDCSIETVARSCQTTESIWNMNFCDGCKRNNGKVTKNIFELVKKNIKDAVRFKQSSMLVDEEAKTESKSKKYSVKFTAFGSLEKADGNSISAADSSMGIKIRRLDFTPVWSRVCDELDEAAFNESFIDSPVKRKNMQSQGTRKRKRGKNVASSRKHLSRRVNEEKSQGSVIDSQEADFDGAHSQETDDETRKRFDGDKESSSGIVSQETEVSRDVTDVVNEKAELCAESCKEQSNPVEGKEIDDVVPPTPPSELPLNDTVYSSNRSVLSKVLQKGGKTRLITDDKRDAKLPLSKVENISNEISLSSVILDDVSENGSQNMFMSGIKGNQSISRNSQVVLESQEDGPKTPNVKCGVSEKPGRDCLVPDEDNSVEKRQTRRVTLKRKAKGPKIGTDNVTKKQKLESICENVNTDSQNGNLSGKSIASKKVSSFQTDSLYDIDSQILIGSENPSGLGQNTESSAEVSKKSQETLVTTGEHGSIVGQHDAPFLVTESRIDISFNDSPIDIVNSQKTNNCVKDNDFQNSAQGNEEQNDRNQEGVLNNNEFTQDIPSSILATSNDQNTADELADTCLEDVPLKKEEFPLEEDECINDAAILFDSNEEVDEGVGGGVGERVDEGVDERVDEGVDDEVEDAAMVKAKENGNNEEAYELCGVKRAGKQSTARAEQFSCLDDDEKDLFASDEEDLIEEEDAAHEEAGTTIEGRTAEPKNDDPEKKNTSDFKSLVRRFSKKGYEENEAEESSEEEPEFIKPSPERYLENNTSIKMKRHYASEAGSELVLVKNTEEITDNCEYESPPSPTPPPRIKKKKTSPQFQETMEMLKKLAAKNDRPMLIEKVDDATVPHKVKPKAAGDVESLSVMTGVNINTRKTEKAEGCHAKNFRKTTENALLPFTGASERFQPGKGQVDNHEFMRQNTPNRGDAHAVNKMTDNKLTVVPQLTVKREIVTTPKLKSESQLRDRGNLNTVGGSFESPARTHKTPSVLVPSRLNRRQMVCCKALADKIGCKFSTSFIDGVSHLIMGTDENFAIDRFAYTYKYLMALITGSWIVSFKWVTSSLNAQKVVDEAQYEVKGDISSNHEMVPKLARNSKQRKDSPLFTDLTLSLVGDFQTCNMTREQLAQLLEKGGAVVMFELPKSIPSKNFLLITDSEDIEGFKSQFIEANIQPVHYQWITESIINYKVQNPAEFLINL